MFTLSEIDPNDAEAQYLLRQLSDKLSAITGDSGERSFEVSDMRLPRSLFVIARNSNGIGIGCGAIRPIDTLRAEVKRMYAVPGHKGVGVAILKHLEIQAKRFEYQEIWLETRRVNIKAVKFYERNGYNCIPNYGKYIGRPDAICLGKTL